MVARRPLDRARDLHGRAQQAYAAGTPRRASALVHRALRLLDGDGDGPGAAELRVRALVTLALSTAELDGIAAGSRVLDLAGDTARRTGSVELDLLIRSQRGALALRAGDFRASSEEYGGALLLVEHAGPADRGVILANAATAHLYLGELARARTLFVRAIELAATYGFVGQQAMSRHNLGYVEFLAGDLPAALETMDGARTLHAGQGEGTALLDQARVLAEAGLTREAERCLVGAATVFARDKLAHSLAETEIELSRVALLGGNVAAARRFAGRARDRFRRRDNARWRRTAELALLQADLAARRPAGRLVPPALRLRDEFAGEGLRLAARAAALIAAEAHAAGGRPDEAAELLTGLGPPSRGDPVTARLQYDYVRALVDSERGDAGAATRRIGRALGMLADHQASFGSVDMRTAAAVHGRRLAQLDIAVARRGGRVDAIFAAAERARAATSRLPDVRPPDDPVAADLLAELRQVIESLRAVENDRAAAAPLVRRRQELERAILARTWTAAGGGTATRPARLAAVRTALQAAGSTMVVYVQDRGSLAAIVLDGRARLVDLGPARPVIEAVRRCRADLDVLASPLVPPPLRAAVRASLVRSAARLDAELVAPLGLGPGPLVIVSTGVLGQLPWASVPSLAGVPVVVAPSATKWLLSAAQPVADLRVAALAGPDLGRGGEEVREVAAAWGDGERWVADAGRAALAASLAGTDLLHVAAHGLHQPENPLFSSLRMSDGPLFAHELTGRTPAHVVLSACEVGLATVRPGDEALGLASVLLQHGTSSVVASVARVNDEQAARVMAAYHRGLATGASSAEALATALADDARGHDVDVVAPFVNLGSAWSARPGLAARTGVA